MATRHEIAKKTLQKGAVGRIFPGFPLQAGARRSNLPAMGLGFDQDQIIGGF